MRFLFIFLFLSLISTFRSQVLVVSFKDSKTNEPIPNVQCKISFLSTDFQVIKDSITQFSLQNGAIYFALTATQPGFKTAKGSIEFQLDYAHPIYQSASKLYAFELKEDTTQLNLYLKAERIQEVRDIVIKSNILKVGKRTTGKYSDLCIITT